MLQVNQSQGDEQGLEDQGSRLFIKLQAGRPGRPMFLPWILCYRETQTEMFSKDAVIHTLYPTFLFIISGFVWVSLRGRTETGSE